MYSKVYDILFHAENYGARIKEDVVSNMIFYDLNKNLVENTITAPYVRDTM